VKFGKVLLQFSSLESTNDYATELLAKSTPFEGTVISADFQTAGKGQGTNKWQSQAEKNLLLSVILKPNNLKVHHSFSLNLMGALSVVSLINKFYPELDPLIKWPNDILIKGKKIGGILIRNQIQGKKIISAVCGFGINVNQLDFTAIEGYNLATSLYLLSGKKIELNSLLYSFLNELEIQADILELNPELLAKTAQPLMYGRNELIRIENRKSGELLFCSIINLTVTGYVKVQEDNGTIREILMTDWKIVN